MGVDVWEDWLPLTTAEDGEGKGAGGGGEGGGGGG